MDVSWDSIWKPSFFLHVTNKHHAFCLVEQTIFVCVKINEHFFGLAHIRLCIIVYLLILRFLCLSFRCFSFRCLRLASCRSLLSYWLLFRGSWFTFFSWGLFLDCSSRGRLLFLLFPLALLIHLASRGLLTDTWFCRPNRRVPAHFTRGC